MRADLMAELGSVCAGLGVALQWGRSFFHVRDAWVVTFGMALAVGLWALGFDWTGTKDVQAAIVHSLPIIFTFSSSLLGGLYGTASAAAYAVTKGADPSHPLVPVTQ